METTEATTPGAPPDAADPNMRQRWLVALPDPVYWWIEGAVVFHGTAEEAKAFCEAEGVNPQALYQDCLFPVMASPPAVPDPA